MSRLTMSMIYKIIIGQSCPVSIQHYVQQRTLRSYHPKHFINLGSTSNTYEHSFCNRIAKEWNALPTERIEYRKLQRLSNQPWPPSQPLTICILILFNRPLHGFCRYLGCEAVAAKITANVWEILQLSTLITPQLHVQF